MSSIFINKTGLRHQFSVVDYTDIAATTNASDAILVANLRQGIKMNFIDNSTDAPVNLYLVHPDADPTIPANRLYWLTIPGDRVINYSTLGSANLEFDPGTRIYASIYSGAPTSGILALAMWG